MSAVADMAKDKKKADPSKGSAEEKMNVKVRLSFHKKLKTVASALGLEIGELVEREMEEFINREVKVLPNRVEE